MELEITNITEENKKEKLTTAALVLASMLDIPLELNGVILEKDELLEKAYKYIRRWKKGEKWYYAYPSNQIRRNTRTKSKETIANTAPLIMGIMPFFNPSDDDVQNEVNRLKTLSREHKLLCSALHDNIHVIDKTIEHTKITRGQMRTKEATNYKFKYLPFTEQILKTGKLAEKSKNGKLTTYGIIGRVKYFDENQKEVIEAVEVAIAYDEQSKKYILSFANYPIKKASLLSKALPPKSSKPAKENNHFVAGSVPGGVTADTTNIILPQSTQKNKSYPDIILDIQNITEANKYEKFTKALKAAAKQLNTPIGVLDMEKTGEKHLYPIKQELSDYWASFYTNILDELYISLTEILELPAVSIETMQKSLISAQAIKKLFGNFKLKYKGSIIYNPETGEPFLRKDFDKLVRAIEDILNLNTKEAAKRITLDSVTVSKLLKRLASFQTSEQLKTHTLDNLKYKNKSFEWIREEYKNLNTVLGEPLSLKEKARYQVCEDKAAQLITRVNDDIRNGIKEVLLDGISERKSKAQVSQDLFNKFGSLNRNWKRIADTEIVNTSNLASVLEEVHSAAQGEKVYFKRYEMANACDKCKKIDGTIALWSDKPLEDDKIKDEFASVAIWEGKAPDSKSNTLVVGALHPHCRGFWERWGAEEVNAQTAMLNGKEKEWNEAVKKAQEEYKTRGIENPHDGTKGYRDRIREIYKELSK